MRGLFIAFSILFVAACAVVGFGGSTQSQSAAARAMVTPVEGPSWLKHLGLRVSETNLGEMGGGSFIPPTPRSEPQTPDGNSFVLAGGDIYRISCRSCHGPEGHGAPPEINSLIGPVQGMSPAMIRQRLKARGLTISDSMVHDMAAQAETAIRQRLQNGGKKMPAFKHLTHDEVNSLLAYLERLADVPESKGGAEFLVHESADHVGEDVVKGTCHTCHNATGPGGGHMGMMMSGIIPSLASLPQDQSLGSVIRQVEYGSPPMMMMMRAERMPALPYLTEEEIAAAYAYLAKYPPRAGRGSE